MAVSIGVWYRVSTGEQSTDNQKPDVRRFAKHHGYRITRTYEVSDSAWKNGGGPEYKRELASALADAHAGQFSILVVWALDRIIRDDENGAEAALRLFRQFRQCGVMIVSVQEPWLNAAPEVQDILVSFAGWMASRESKRRSERTKAGLARRAAENPDWKPGRQAGAVDLKPRKRSGYVARWERARA